MKMGSWQQRAVRQFSLLMRVLVMLLFVLRNNLCSVSALCGAGKWLFDVLWFACCRLEVCLGHAVIYLM